MLQMVLFVLLLEVNMYILLHVPGTEFPFLVEYIFSH